MTKAELITAMKDMPDDMKIKFGASYTEAPFLSDLFRFYIDFHKSWSIF